LGAAVNGIRLSGTSGAGWASGTVYVLTPGGAA
jgi:hypothetical protein